MTHSEYDLKDNRNKIVGSVIPLRYGKHQLFGLDKSLGITDKVVDSEQLEDIKQVYGLVKAEQMNIFDIL